MNPNLYIRTFSAPVRVPGTSVYYRTITIDHTKCGSADSYNHNVYVNITDNTLRTVANGGRVTNSNAYDIYFTSDHLGVTLLNWEVKFYSATTGNIIAYIKLDTVSHSADTVFYMFYGNSSITTFQGGATGAAWHSSYRLVAHLDGAASPYTDSTTNGNNSVSGTYPTQTTGKLYKGQSFNGSSQYIDWGYNSSLKPTAAITVSCWVYFNSLSTNQRFITDWHNSSSTDRWLFYTPTATQIGFGICNAGEVTFVETDYTVSAATWYHVVGTYDGSNAYLYVNGASIGSAPLTGAMNAGALASVRTGKQAEGANYFNGILDELRINDTALSVDTILTNYNNQSSPGTFYTVGSEFSL